MMMAAPATGAACAAVPPEHGVTHHDVCRAEPTLGCFNCGYVQMKPFLQRSNGFELG